MTASLLFLPCLKHHMLVHNILPCKKNLTLDTLIWGFSNMCTHMLTKSTLQCKTFLTLDALIWFLSCIKHCMISFYEDITTMAALMFLLK